MVDVAGDVLAGADVEVDVCCARSSSWTVVMDVLCPGRLPPSIVYRMSLTAATPAPWVPLSRLASVPHFPLAMS